METPHSNWPAVRGGKRGEEANTKHSPSAVQWKNYQHSTHPLAKFLEKWKSRQVKCHQAQAGGIGARVAYYHHASAASGKALLL